jgi:hypothetical protein
MINAINNGIVLGNANSPLSGQYFISNSEFALFQTASVRQSCITLQSGGNLVIASSMVHFCNVGLHVQQNNGTLLGDIFITGSSFEQSDNAGIIFDKGTSTTVQTIQIVGNDFGGGTPSGIVVNGATAFLQDMSIQGNTFYPNNSSAIILPNGASLGDGAITITGNVFATGGGTPTGINVTGNAVKGMAAGNTFRGLTTNVANASPFFLAENLVNGHTSYVGVAPTLTAGCNGAGQVTTGATDRSGTITGQTTAHTTCTLTFAQAYAVAPSCVAMGISSPLTTTAVSTTTTLVVNFANTANFKWTYWCPGT